MPATATITVVRPVVGNTDTITAALYNASGVVSATGEITGAVATDGSTPITGDLNVNGKLTAGTVETTTVNATTITAGSVAATDFASTGLLTASGTLKIGAAGTVMNGFVTGSATVAVNLTVSGATTATVTATIAGATAAVYRAFFLNNYLNGDFAIISYTVAAGDQVTITYKRVNGSAGSGTANYLLIALMIQ